MAYKDLDNCCFQQISVEILGALNNNVNEIKNGDNKCNISIGIGSLCSNLCANATCNVAIGLNALSAYISGSCNALLPGGDSFNTVVGAGGFSCLVCGGYNTLLGAGNAPIMTCGDYNTIIGSTNLFFSSASFAQVAVGSQVLQNWCGVAETGRNIGIGFSAIRGALASCGGMTGERNIGIGMNAGLRLKGANTNILLGNNSGYVSDTDGCHLKDGCWNIIVGHHSGRGLVNGNFNTIIGSCIGKTVPLGDISNSVIIGDGCGCIRFETNSDNQVKIGNAAGNGACNSFASNFMGVNAGNSACNTCYSNVIGFNANSVINSTCFAGGTCCYQGNICSIMIGNNAGTVCFVNNGSAKVCYYKGVTNAVMIGNEAGFFSRANSCCYKNDNDNSVFIGTGAGYNTCCSWCSNFIGAFAGYNSAGSFCSNFIGACAGILASNSNGSNFIGNKAGACACLSRKSNFIGSGAGISASCSWCSNFIGEAAGYNANCSSASTFIGLNAGYSSCSSYNSVFIGTNIGASINNIPNTLMIGINGYFASNVASATCVCSTFASQAARGLCMSIAATGVVTTCLYSGSLREMKKDICPFTSCAIDLINNIDVVSYRYKTQGDTDLDVHVGFIADDTDELFSAPEHNRFKTGTAIGVLLKAVKELNEEITCLKAQIK